MPPPANAIPQSTSMINAPAPIFYFFERVNLHKISSLFFIALKINFCLCFTCVQQRFPNNERLVKTRSFPCKNKYYFYAKLKDIFAKFSGNFQTAKSI